MRPFAALLLGLAAGSLQAADGFKPMLDPGLTQWEKWLGPPHRSFEVPGYVRAEKPKDDPPLGLNNDPLGVFSTRMENGEVVLHITGQVFGALTTLAEYGDFHLRTEQRWGEKRWVPRADKQRDNGILIFCTGEHGAQAKFWMRSQECQVQEQDIGDYWPLAGALCDIPVVANEKALRKLVYDPKAEPRPVFSRVWHGDDYQEKPNGEWNLIEVVALDGHAVFRLNGRTVNVILNSRYREKGSETELPMKSGRIQVQSEAAECEYRRMEIKPLREWPAEVRKDLPASALVRK